MDQYRVVLGVEVDGCLQTLEGIALDLKVRSAEEHLIVREDSGETQEVRIDRIRHANVLTTPSRFREHSFGVIC